VGVVADVRRVSVRGASVMMAPERRRMDGFSIIPPGTVAPRTILRSKD
jgi:hypothetical protein